MDDRLVGAADRDQWLGVLREYLDFADDHYKRYDFRCNMPLGSYFVKKDDSSLLSYSGEGDVFSIDPIHAPSDQAAWDRTVEIAQGTANLEGATVLTAPPTDGAFTNDIIVECWSLASFIAVSRTCKLYDYDTHQWRTFSATGAPV